MGRLARLECRIAGGRIECREELIGSLIGRGFVPRSPVSDAGAPLARIANQPVPVLGYRPGPDLEKARDRTARRAGGIGACERIEAAMLRCEADANGCTRVANS